MIKKYTDNIKLHGLENKHWYFITLTIRHNKSHSLEHLLNRLFSYRDTIARRMRNSKRPEQRSKSFFHYFDGVAISTEITCDMTKNGRHPHLHILACSDYDIPIDKNKYYGCKSTNDDLYNEQKNLTKDSDQLDTHKIQVRENQHSRQSIGEVFKYAIKFGKLETPQFAEIMYLQHKHQYRFFANYGIVRGWKLENTKKFHGEWND